MFFYRTNKGSLSLVYASFSLLYFHMFIPDSIPKASLRRDAVTPSCSVRGQPEGKPVRLSAVAAGEGVPCYSFWKRFGNSAGGTVSLPI